MRESFPQSKTSAAELATHVLKQREYMARRVAMLKVFEKAGKGLPKDHSLNASEALTLIRNRSDAT